MFVFVFVFVFLFVVVVEFAVVFVFVVVVVFVCTVVFAVSLTVNIVRRKNPCPSCDVIIRIAHLWFLRLFIGVLYDVFFV